MSTDTDTKEVAEDDEENNSTDSVNNLVYSPVKSTAIVKYSAVESPATFALLECNTDLNLPPANWLSSSAESYGLRYVLSNSTEFSSLRMADMFPDCVGEVDVISDAENVKKLLKLPYSRGPVSMLVHRIKATLLIDDFDIHKFLFKSAEINWHALKNFLLENVFHSVENTKKCITHESKRRYTLQEENLISKFLYHSIGHLEEQQPKKLKFNKSKDEQRKCDPSNSTPPPFPESDLNSELPDGESEHMFARNVVWTFNNIQMLLGTDMPIFGGGTHPCVSLRLRDMSKPISVLTGIDYWLDNLMCNVPEVAMCYHIQGIVQKYELIKTEDLPYMEDSKFSPALIRDVAQNILAFLKSNATKAGHTYWLLKGKDDDVVKLYDLTSLCSNNMVDSTQNPFTIPVALLLYRVARNMIHSPRVKLPTNPATVRMLLKNCIRLLPKEKYPQIITSAHYMFSDSLIPLNTDPTSPKLEDISEKVFNDGYKKDILFDDDENDDEVDVAIKTLCLSKKLNISGEKAKGKNLFNEEEPEIMRNLEKRCQVAIEHIADGLNCLKFFDDVDSGESSKTKSRENENLNMAHPGTPIPMPYETIKKENDECSAVEKCESKKKKATKNKEEAYKSIGALLCQSHIETMPTWQHPPDVDDIMAWKKHLKILLYEKACLVYATLAEYEYSVERYGNALKHIRFVLESRAHLTNGSCENILMSYLLGRAGDFCFQIGRKWDLVDNYKLEYSKLENFDAKMKIVMDEDKVEQYKELDFLPSEITTLDNILNNSWMCYSKALELENRDSERDNLHRRLGNICNELGSFYMKKARETMPDTEVPKEQVEALFAISMTHLENGIKAFKSVNDDANLALLYSNTGRLMRLMAHFYSEDNMPLNKVTKKFYNKALSDYQSALTALSYRRLNPEIWDTVFYELSTTLYTMATLLQDCSPQNSLTNKSELEREVKEYLSKALKYCDMETPGPKQPIYQYRAADIHHRLASLYHSMFRDLDKELPRRNKNAQLCHLHYERAVKLYLNLELPAQFLRAQLERIALYEYLSESSSGNSNKIKALQSALDLILQCAPILKVICDRKENVSSSFAVTDEKGYQFGAKLKTKEKMKFQPDDTANCKISSNVRNDHDNNSKSPPDAGVNSTDIKNQDHKCVEEACKNTDDEDDDDDDDDDKIDEIAEEKKMLELLESRLLYILRVLTKRCTSLSTQPKFSSLATKYKSMYAALLKSSEDHRGKVRRLYEILQEYADINN